MVVSIRTAMELEGERQMTQNKSLQARKPRRHGLRHDIRTNYDLYLLAIPGVLYYALFKYWPMYGLQIAFRKYNPALGITGSPWVGLEYFEKFVNVYQFGSLMSNTFLLSFYALVVGFPIPIILALLLNSNRTRMFKKSVQMVTYAPHFISVVVLVSLLKRVFRAIDGAGEQPARDAGPIARAIHGQAAVFPAHVDVWSGIWQNMGWDSIIYISALSGVSLDLHEAATVEGATRFQRILHIDLPHIVPTATILLIMNCGNLLNVGFDKVYLLQNDQNLRHAQVISTYVYEMGLLKNQTSYSSAVGRCSTR